VFVCAPSKRLTCVAVPGLCAHLLRKIVNRRDLFSAPQGFLQSMKKRQPLLRISRLADANGRR
jgi:hypothetical protein